MKKFKKQVIIPIGVYEKELLIFYNYSDSDVKRYIKSKNYINDESLESWNTLFDGTNEKNKGTYIGNGKNHIITIAEDYDEKSLINTFTHEIMHFVFGLTQHVGMRLANESEEAFTYLMGYTMGEAYDKIIEPVMLHQALNPKIQTTT